MSEPTSAGERTEQPKGPNFLMVVILFAVAILVVFIFAYFVLKGGGRHLVPGKHNPHPTSQLVLPAGSGGVLRAGSGAESPFILPQQKILFRV
jgi:hypothetical protein